MQGTHSFLTITDERSRLDQYTSLRGIGTAGYKVTPNVPLSTECTLDDYVSEPLCKSAELEGPFQPVWRVAEKASCSSGMQLPMFNSVWCRKRMLCLVCSVPPCA